MKKMTKIVVCLLLTLMTLIVSPIASFAALPEDNTVSPMWDSLSSIAFDVNFDETLGRATAIVRKKSTASNIEATVTVYKQIGTDEWEFLSSNYGQKSVGTLVVSSDFTPEVGATYKAVLVVTAYTNNVPETETIERIKTNS